MKKSNTDEIKKYFSTAKSIETAMYKEIINMEEYDLNSVFEVEGNFYIVHKEDINLDGRNFTKRVKCLFYVKTGLAKVHSRVI